MFGWEEVYTGYSRDGFETVVKWLKDNHHI
jgi:hypothetical protein